MYVSCALTQRLRLLADLDARFLVVVVDPVVDLFDKVVDVSWLVGNKPWNVKSRGLWEDEETPASQNFGNAIGPITISILRNRNLRP